jgi:hypothetical protein
MGTVGHPLLAIESVALRSRFLFDLPIDSRDLDISDLAAMGRGSDYRCRALKLEAQH